jgi:hypothetical protein
MRERGREQQQSPVLSECFEIYTHVYIYLHHLPIPCSTYTTACASLYIFKFIHGVDATLSRPSSLVMCRQLMETPPRRVVHH